MPASAIQATSPHSAVSLATLAAEKLSRQQEIRSTEFRRDDLRSLQLRRQDLRERILQKVETQRVLSDRREAEIEADIQAKQYERDHQPAPDNNDQDEPRLPANALSSHEARPGSIMYRKFLEVQSSLDPDFQDDNSAPTGSRLDTTA